ncbi:hypothetical protein GQ607_004758 [Colletotrichum asianum]|uniref:Uncharacterized protein n=1 Tax=Colletotrichum asianum TaxID=702518 RepID=A0A8H3WLD3_9PEZI|nr:hypothetical protein GQ607_004758 [Colletotrichum asianum]
MKTSKRCAKKNRRQQGWARWSTVEVPSLPVTVGFVESGSQGLQFRLRQSTTMPVLSCVCVTVPVVRTSACLLQVGGARAGVGEGRGSSSVRQKAVMDHFAASPFSAWGPVGIGVKKRRQCALQPKDQDRERKKKKKKVVGLLSRACLSQTALTRHETVPD